MTYELQNDSDGHPQLQVMVGGRKVFGCTMIHIAPAKREWLAKIISESLIETADHFYNKGQQDVREEVQRALGLA